MLSKITLHIILSDDRITGMKKKTAKASRKPKASSATMLRAYRFNARLFEKFEADCVRHLRNPRAVLEALIFHWLQSNPAQRDAIAEQNQQVERRTDKSTRSS
jgi:hypothetical protein